MTTPAAMAVPTIVVFQTLNANHGQEKGGEKSDAGLPPPALNVAELKKHDGLVRARYGPKMEDPAVGVLCTGELPSSVLPLLQCSYPWSRGLCVHCAYIGSVAKEAS